MRKKIYYMDMAAVENQDLLTPIEHITRERILTTRDWDSLIFWMDIELAFKLLTDYERHCFILSFIEGYTEDEIAFCLNITHQAVSKQVKKSRKKIKAFLKEAYQAV